MQYAHRSCCSPCPVTHLQMFQRTTGVLQSLLLAHMTPNLADSFTWAETGTLQEQLFDIYAEYVLEEHRDELQAYK